MEYEETDRTSANRLSAFTRTRRGRSSGGRQGSNAGHRWSCSRHSECFGFCGFDDHLGTSGKTGAISSHSTGRMETPEKRRRICGILGRYAVGRRRHSTLRDGVTRKIDRRIGNGASHCFVFDILRIALQSRRTRSVRDSGFIIQRSSRGRFDNTWVSD